MADGSSTTLVPGRRPGSAPASGPVGPACLRLPPGPGTVAVARRHVRRTLVAHRLGDVADDAELVVSELVGNVARHARTGCEVAVELQPGTVLVLVRDDDPTLPVGRAAGDDGTTGRGLDIVRAVSAACGVARSGRGKVVWCVLVCTGPAAGR